MGETAIDFLRRLIQRDLGRRAGDPWRQFVRVANEDEHGNCRVFLDTAEHRYSITANGASDRSPNSYLGCVASSRRWSPGEDWHRGNDLPDGPLTEETWREIINGIVAYELETMPSLVGVGRESLGVSSGPPGPADPPGPVPGRVA